MGNNRSNSRLFYIKRTNKKGIGQIRMENMIVKLNPQGEIPSSHRTEIKFHYFPSQKTRKETREGKCHRNRLGLIKFSSFDFIF